MMNYKIGIVVADSDEYKSLLDFIRTKEYEDYSFLNRTGHKFILETDNGSAEIISLLCGIGKVNATAAAMHLVDIGCDIILNYGLSGGISGISRGELMACTKLLEHDFDLTGIGYKLCEKPSQKYIYDADNSLIELFTNEIANVKRGTAVSGDRFVCDAALRDSLKINFGAMSCDMETAAIAYVCDASDVPFFALRRISDDAGADALDSYREMNTSDDTLLSSYIIEFILKIIDTKLR